MSLTKKRNLPRKQKIKHVRPVSVANGSVSVRLTQDIKRKSPFFTSVNNHGPKLDTSIATITRILGSVRIMVFSFVRGMLVVVHVVCKHGKTKTLESLLYSIINLKIVGRFPQPLRFRMYACQVVLITNDIHELNPKQSYIPFKSRSSTCSSFLHLLQLGTSQTNEAD